MTRDDFFFELHNEIYSGAVALGAGDIFAIKLACSVCEKIQAEFGGGRHYVPAAEKEKRNQEIANAVKAGRPPEEVAKQLGVSPRTVRRVARQPGEDCGFGSPDWNL